MNFTILRFLNYYFHSFEFDYGKLGFLFDSMHIFQFKCTIFYLCTETWNMSPDWENWNSFESNSVFHIQTGFGRFFDYNQITLLWLLYQLCGLGLIQAFCTDIFTSMRLTYTFRRYESDPSATFIFGFGWRCVRI